MRLLAPPIVLSLLLCACAGARKAPAWEEDGAPFTEQGTVVKEQGASVDILTEFPDVGIPREAGTTAQDLTQGAEAGGVVDGDGDGHCAAGTTDPGGKCKSFNDCNDNDKTVYPGAQETCNDVGTDNDCDNDKAEVDMDLDGVNDLGSACKKGLPGICDAGTRHCKMGQLVCQGKYTPGQISEACNGEDDDCNGQTDDGQLCANGNSCAGASGCSCNGGQQCSGAAHCCTAGCKSLTVDTLNCGACNISCGAGETCDGGRCRCGSTLGSKGGGPVCTQNACVSGQCGPACDTTNLAPGATATSSGGGAASLGYGPEKMNDGYLASACASQKFCWITAGSSLSGGKWIQYTWPKAVTIGRVWFDTDPTGGGCTKAGRTLAGGRLQYYSGLTWKTLASITGRTNDWSWSFSPVSTTRIRLYDAHATSATGQKSNPVIIEWRVSCK